MNKSQYSISIPFHSDHCSLTPSFEIKKKESKLSQHVDLVRKDYEETLVLKQSVYVFCHGMTIKIP